MAQLADTILDGDSLLMPVAWLGACAYMLQIYFDFSAYSDMAIGLGKMLGFDFDENFDYPYKSTSITEFWRRWHISLSTWFRDYVYIPLGGNRNGVKRQIFNTFIVWSLTGFWHGASWNYLLWGIYYFVLLSLEKFVFSKFTEKCRSSSNGSLLCSLYRSAGYYSEVMKQNLNENVIIIDAYEEFIELESQGHSCYLTTDHHINITGGFCLYSQLIDIIRRDFPTIREYTTDDYQISPVVVNGSFNRLIGQSVKADAEPLVIRPRFTINYTRTDNGASSDKAVWGVGNTYAYAYMTGDNAETIIVTNNTDCPNVLFTGASFTNILESLIVPNCSIMASVDYRYNETGKSIYSYVTELDADYVIYVPSQSNNALGYSKMKTHLGLD